jgi:hypothetical protein
MKQLMDCRSTGVRGNLSATASAFGRVVHRHSVVTVAAGGIPCIEPKLLAPARPRKLSYTGASPSAWRTPARDDATRSDKSS